MYRLTIFVKYYHILELCQILTCREELNLAPEILSYRQRRQRRDDDNNNNNNDNDDNRDGDADADANQVLSDTRQRISKGRKKTQKVEALALDKRTKKHFFGFLAGCFCSSPGPQRDSERVWAT